MTTLALVMIARNEAKLIARCLDSARAHVDRLIVLDTGSTDDTVAIARAHGAQVEGFAWCDDFAAARNAALDLSDADFNLVLDADEWLQDAPAHVGATLAAAIRGGPVVGIVCQVNRFRLMDRDEVSPAWIPRLLPRGVRYQGRIHEQPASSLPRRRIALSLGHDGYLPERSAAKEGRNRVLLERALHETPDDAYLWFQLGKDHEVYRRWAEAADCYERALARGAPHDRFRHDLVVRQVFALKCAGRHAQGLAFGQAQLEAFPQSPDLSFALGDLLLDLAVRQPQAALTRWLPQVESNWLRCLEIGERPGLEGTVRGRGSFLAAHNLAVVYEGLGQAARAEEFRRLADRLRGESLLAAA